MASINRRLFFSVLFVLAIGATNRLQSQQAVYLDFTTGTDGAIPYSAADMTFIMDIMDDHYSAFDFTFTLSAPGAGPYSTITFNAGSSGGLAQHIDFGNVDKNDSAVVNIDGLGLSVMSEINTLTAVIGSHELGHLQGLRHADSFGPIGSGIHAPPGLGAYSPAYPGPTGAVETNNHIMSSPAATGQTIADALTPSWFSERSAVKLAFNEGGSYVVEAAGAKGSIATAQSLTLSNLAVPNTIQSGANAAAGPFFSVDAVSVLGELSTGAETDFYSFTGATGDLMNLALMSNASGWKAGFSDFDTAIRVLDSSGIVIPYYSGTAENDNEFETLDSILIDLWLPSDGTFFVEVDRSSLSAGSFGDYELFMYRFNGTAVPEPGSAMAIGMFCLSVCFRRRRRD